MARRAGVEVEGLAQLRRSLRGLGEDLADLKDANRDAARVVATAAAARAPRRTGRLAASLRPARAAAAASVVAGSAQVPYAGPVHWGWPARHIEGNPFAMQAADATRHVWLPIYERELQRALDRVNGA